MSIPTLREGSGENRQRADVEVARAEAQVDRLTGGGPRLDDVDRLVDHVIAGHGAVLATLERDLPLRFRDELDALRPTGRGAVTESFHREARAVIPDPHPGYTALMHDTVATASSVHPTLERQRERRRALVATLAPSEFRPRTRQPVITRGGVFYVAPRFDQARGLGDVSDARLIRAGYVTAESVLQASDEEVAELTGQPVHIVRAGKQDLDLTRLPGIDRKAADLLRFVNVHSVSRLATRDPARLAAELARVNERHRIWGFPEALASSAAVTRLVKKAEALAAL